VPTRRPTVLFLALRHVALAAAVCLVATGCLSGEVEVVVNDDGSGRVVVEVLPEGPLADALRSVELERLVELSAEGVNGAEFETFERDGRVGYRLTIDFDDADGAVQALSSGVTVVGQPVKLLDSGELRELPDGGGWELSAKVVPADQILVAPAGGGEAGAAGGLSALVAAAAAPDSGSGLNLSISLPGRVTDTNADSFSGGTATWRLDEPEAPTELRVRTEPDPFPLPMRLLAGGAALVVLAVVFLIVRRTRRRRREAAPAQQPPAPPPMPPGQPEWAPVPNGWAPPTPSVPSTAQPVPSPPPAPAAPMALADLPPPAPTPPPAAPGAPMALSDLPPPVPNMPPPVPAPPRSTLPVLPPLEPLEPAQPPPEPPLSVDPDAV
jgi:hypothetical protein